jgi:SAM-dependent methyltransferase
VTTHEPGPARVVFSPVGYKLARRVASWVDAKRIEGRWSPKLGGDETFRAKFLTVPEILDSWISQHRSFRDADVLDFGCGEGTAALGLALNYGPRSVVGVDIMPDPERCLPLAREQLGLDVLPGNLALHRVIPGRLHDASAGFDIAYSWSVFEHVEDRLLDGTLQLLHSALRPRGLLFVQIAPLFYSSGGSHLMHKIGEPWAHLLNQHNVYYEKLVNATADSAEREALWSMYRTLNRITADELVERLEGAGFEILRTYTTRDEAQPPRRLAHVFREEALRTSQVVVLGRRV